MLASAAQWGEPPAGVEEYVEGAIVIIESSCEAVPRCRAPPAKIYYTLNGEVPDIMTSELYDPNNPIIFNHANDHSSLQIRAMAVAQGMKPSDVATSDLLEIIQRASQPKISPASGTTHCGAVQVPHDACIPPGP